MMQPHKTPQYPSPQTAWGDLLASIPDTDLDLLISAGQKMQRREAILNAHELEACLRWYPHIDILPTSQQDNFN